MKLGKKFAISVGALLVLFVILRVSCAGRKAATDDGPLSAEVQGGDFYVLVHATGQVVANRQVKVSSKASGEIVELPWEAGDIVEEGKLLVRLDPEDEQRNVRNMEFEVQSAQAHLEIAKRELKISESGFSSTLKDQQAAADATLARLEDQRARHKRMQELFQEGLVPKEELDSSATSLRQSENDYKRSQASLEDSENMTNRVATRKQDVTLAEVQLGRAEVSLEQARQRLADTSIVAPMSGTITELKVERGQVISSAISNIGGGTDLLVLSDLSKIYVIAKVDESDIGGIQLGQTAKIQADAFADLEFDGTVHHIAPIGMEKNGVVTFDVKIEVQGEGIKRLRPGMTAEARILTGHSLDTHWVQSGAIREDEKGPYLDIVTMAGGSDKVYVKVGLSDGLYTEVLEGVKAGQRAQLPESQVESSLARRRRSGEMRGEM